MDDDDDDDDDHGVVRNIQRRQDAASAGVTVFEEEVGNRRALVGQSDLQVAGSISALARL